MTRPSFQVYTKLDLEYPTESNDKNHIHTAEKPKTTGDVCSTISPAGAIREVFPNQRACCAILQSPAEHMARMFLYSFTPPSSKKKKKIYCRYSNEQTLRCCVHSTSKRKVESLPTKIRTSSLPNYYCTHDITSRQSYFAASSLCCITLCTFG